MIMKQDKGRSALIMDEHKSTEKCLEVFNWQKQRSKEFYNKSRANLRSRNIIVYTLQVLVLGNFMVPLRYTDRYHMTKKDQLPKRPIVSNIGTATSNLARHLALLSPLSKCKYTIDSMKHFMKRLNKKQRLIYKDFLLMSSHCLRTCLINYYCLSTIDIILERIYDRKEMNT